MPSFALRHGRALAIVGSAAGYLVAFALLYPLFGINVCTLAAVPVALSAWYGGVRWGLVAAAAALTVNSGLLALAGEPGGWAAVFVTGGAPRAAVAVALVGAVAWARDKLDRLARAEEALRASEARKAAVLDAAPDAVIALDPAGGVVEFNAAAREMFGYRREEVLGLPLARLLAWPEEGADGLDAVVGKRMELTARRADGGEFPAEVTLARAGSADRAVLTAFVRDLTHLKRAQRALRESEERYRGLVDQAADAIFVLDSQGRILDANRRAWQGLGYTRDELLALTANDLDPTARRHDLRPGDTLTLETTHRRKDGGAFPVEIRMGLMEVGGRYLKLALARDVTARRWAEAALRKSESLLRLVWENAADGMRLTDRDGTVVMVNPAYCKLVGRRPEEVVGRPMADSYAPARREDMTRKYRERFNARIDRPHVQAAVELWDGRRRWFEVGYAYLDLPGEPALLLSVVRDVTDRKRAEEALRESEARYRMLFEANPQPMWVFDAQTLHFLAVNDAAVERYGYTRAEFLGMTLADIRRPEDLPALHAWAGKPLPEMHAGVAGRHRWKDGTVREVEISSHALWYLDRPARLVLAVDVTDRKRAADAVRESEERLREAFDQAAIGMALVALDGRWLRVNPALCEIVGYTEAELLERRFQDITHPDDLDPDLTRARRLLAGEGRSYQREKRYIHKAGHPVWVLVNVSLVRGADGAPVQFVAQVQDITARKGAEAALRERDELLQNVIAHIPCGVFWKDRDLRLAGCNERFARDHGFLDPAAVVGKTDYELPVDRAEAEFFRDCDRRVMETGVGLVNVEETQTRPDGARAVMLTSKVPLRDHDGGVAGVLGVYLDITDRKRAEAALRQREELLRNIIAHIPCAVFWKDRADVYLGCNDRVARDWGLPSPEWLVGKTDLDICPEPADAEFYRACDRRVMETGESMLNYEETQTRPDGERSVLLTSKVPLRDEAGAVVGVLGVYQDVTDRKRLEEQYRQAQKMEAVGRLAGGVAHDFNNLLTVINGYGQLLLGTLPEYDAARPGLQEIVRAGERAANLTRQLLAFSRKTMLKPRVLDLNAVLADLGKMLPRLVGEDVEVRTALAADLWRVKADPGQVEQVVMNLVVNARDAMPTGGKLTIETANVRLDEAYCRDHADVRPGPYVMLAVSDTGYGMDPATMARVFEPFFTTKGPGKGTGLGLATVYGIVKQSGGSVFPYSEPGLGTTFKVYLPRAEGAGPEPEPEAVGEVAPGGRETVLLVEDEESVRELTRRVLYDRGYRVLEAADGADALALSDRHPGPIHLLLTDVVMPRVSGRELADRLAAARPGVRVLYMSGYTDDAVVRHGILADGVLFVQKPFTPEFLAARVREAIDRGR